MARFTGCFGWNQEGEKLIHSFGFPGVLKMPGNFSYTNPKFQIPNYKKNWFYFNHE